MKTLETKDLFFFRVKLIRPIFLVTCMSKNKLFIPMSWDQLLNSKMILGMDTMLYYIKD